MPSTIEGLQASVPTYLARVRQMRVTLEQAGAVGRDAWSEVVSDLRRQAVAEIGGAVSNYFVGRRRPGQRIGRLAIDASRRARKAKVTQRAKDSVVWFVAELEAAVRGGLEEPIDWKFQRHLLAELARAKSAVRPVTVLTRLEGILGEIDGYSPPQDDFTTVPRLERWFRETIRTRLSVVDPNWWVAKIPAQVRNRAHAARKARGSDRTDPLLFLTFGDYGKIILADANWEDVFHPILGDRDKFEILVARLVVLRNDVAHSRPLSSRDRVELQGYLGELLARSAGNS